MSDPRIPYYLDGEVKDLATLLQSSLPYACNRTRAIECGVKFAKALYALIERSGALPISFCEASSEFQLKYPALSAEAASELASAFLASARATWDHIGAIKTRK